MKIASVVSNRKDSGEHLLLLSRKECQDLLDILTGFCEQNKRKKTARKYLKELEENLMIF